MEVQEMVTTVGFQLQFSFVVVYHRGDITVIWLWSLLHICTVIIIINNSSIAYECVQELGT